ncbi:MAG: flavin reductase family protein, partial [Chloroflexota bacterium]|nr:flavin reductase family protein [Chloroflexota bacterium]
MTDSTGVAAPKLDQRAYREVLGRFATGVTVVTTLEQTVGGPQPWGTTVNSFTAVSLDPPLILVCVGRNRSIHPIIERARRFGVNVLGEGSQALSDCFAGAPSPMPKEAFCGADYEISATE